MTSAMAILALLLAPQDDKETKFFAFLKIRDDYALGDID